MKLENMEKAFQMLDETAAIIEKECHCTYLEAIAETAENIFQGDVLQDELSEMSKKRLLKIYETVSFMDLDDETKRKAYQLCILKGMKQNIQPNHQMTPDSIGLFLSYLVRKCTDGQSSFRILDPVGGTGNLLFTIMSQFKDKELISISSEVDDLLVKLAYSGANLLQYPVEFYNGDSIKPLMVDPVDIVVADLPVGYYPDDVTAAEYEVKADDEKTYAHHLIIEQSVRHLKAGGRGLFLVPNSIFESKQSGLLRDFLKKECYIQGLIALPSSLFKSEQSAKSVLMIRKKKEGISAPKQALLVQLPKLSDSAAMQSILSQMDEWFRTEG